MIEFVKKYLMDHGGTATSIDLAKAVLKSDNIQKKAAEAILSSLLQNEPAISKTEQGDWRLEKRVKQHDKKESVILVKILPETTPHPSTWQHISFTTLLDNEIISKKFFSFHDHTNLSNWLYKNHNTHLIFDGFGNQITTFNWILRTTVGFEPELNISSMRKIVNNYFGEKINNYAKLADFLKTDTIEEGTIQVMTELLIEQFQSLIEKTGLEEFINERDATETYVDFSPFHFDQDFLQNLPNTPGVYMMYNSSHDIIYIGKSKNLYKRVSSYFHTNIQHEEKIKKIHKELKTIEIQQTGSELEALLLEQTLIEKHRPPINKQLLVKERTHWAKHRFDQILFLPSKEPDHVIVYLYHAQKGYLSYNASKDLANIDKLLEKIFALFFKNSLNDLKNSELLITWLSLNSESVDKIDMRKIASEHECERLVKMHIQQFDPINRNFFH